MQQRLKAAILSVGLSLALIVTGCGSKTNTPGETPAPAPAPAPAANAPAPTDKGPKSGGTLTMATGRASTNLYPGHSTSIPDIAVNFMLYDGLMIADGQGKLQPLLAKSWSSDAEGKVWTFELRDDVTFHSGNKFTSKDVKAHFDQWITDAPTKSKVATVEKVETDGDYKVVITLKVPNLVFLSMISQTEWSYGGIPDSAMVAKYGKDYGINPESISGTGPYIMKEWVRDDRIVLERNPNYKWGPAMYNNDGAAYPERVVLRTIPEAASRAAELEVGSIDVDLDLSPAEGARLLTAKGLKVVTAPKNTAHHLGYNLDHELFKDIRVRQALAHLVDQEAMVNVVYEGFASTAVGLFAETVEGHAPKDEIAQLQAAFDVEKAKQLLDEAGWKEGSGGVRQKDGKPLTVTVSVYTEPAEKMVITMQAAARQAGVDLKVKRLEFAAFRQHATNQEHEMFYMDGSHSTADFAYWWTTTSIPYPNHARITDIDDLFDTTQTTTNPDERIKAFHEIEKILVGKYYLIPMPRTVWLVGLRDNVHYSYWDPIHGIQKALDIWIDN